MNQESLALATIIGILEVQIILQFGNIENRKLLLEALKLEVLALNKK